jgi:hypothetical protein
MTGEEFRRIREDLGLSTEKFGRALGYQGTYGIAARHIRRFESGANPSALDREACRYVWTPWRPRRLALGHPLALGPTASSPVVSRSQLNR